MSDHNNTGTGLYLLLYVEAFERKAELGGGFRAVGVNKYTGQRMADNDIHPTLEAARNQCHRWAAEQLADRNAVTGNYSQNKSRFRRNYFIRADEVHV